MANATGKAMNLNFIITVYMTRLQSFVIIGKLRIKFR